MTAPALRIDFHVAAQRVADQPLPSDPVMSVLHGRRKRKRGSGCG